MEVKTRDLLDYLYLHEKDLTARQLEFIDSVKKQYKKYPISEKQFAILNEIKKYHNKTVPRYSMKINN